METDFQDFERVRDQNTNCDEIEDVASVHMSQMAKEK